MKMESVEPVNGNEPIRRFSIPGSRFSIFHFSLAEPLAGGLTPPPSAQGG
jgi:hypothetical protein